MKQTRLPQSIVACRGWLTIAAVSSAWALPTTSTAAERITIGSGSGQLDYPNAQKDLKLHPGDTLYIAAGTYTGLSFSNLSGAAGAPITITCDPEAVFTTRTPVVNHFVNIAHLRFENFRYENYHAGIMEISGDSHDLLFKNYHITSADGYCFRVYDPAKVFNGHRESAFYNFKWEGVAIDGKTNGAALSSSDYAPVSNLKSVLLDFEVDHCTFSHFDNTLGAFPVIGFDKAFNLRIHDCSFSDIGMAVSPIGHDCCIVGSGTFQVYNNRFTRQWANDVRLFPMKLNVSGYDGPNAVTRFYNNISWEKRKYPMFEQNRVPQRDLDASSGYFSRNGSEICFNTLYRSRKAATSGDPYVGQLVDVYSPDVTIKYNAIIEPEADTTFDPKRNYIYALGTGPQPGIVEQGNKVFRTLAEAKITDLESFTPAAGSPLIDAVGGKIDYITDDHYHHERYVGAGADVGAVERQTDSK